VVQEIRDDQDGELESGGGDAAQVLRGHHDVRRGAGREEGEPALGLKVALENERRQNALFASGSRQNALFASESPEHASCERVTRTR